MFSFIVGTILIYFLIRFVFNFLIPLFRVTRQMKDQVKDFNSRMAGRGQYQTNGGEYDPTGHAFRREQERAAPKKPAAKPKAGDYIDFEEIR